MGHVCCWTKCVMGTEIVWEERMKAILLGVQSVKLMEMFALLVAAQKMQAEWSTAGMEHGALCVMISGTTQMQLLCVANWDSPLNV